MALRRPVDIGKGGNLPSRMHLSTSKAGEATPVASNISAAPSGPPSCHSTMGFAKHAERVSFGAASPLGPSTGHHIEPHIV